MDKQIKMHAEYRVETMGNTNCIWLPYSNVTHGSIDAAKKDMESLAQLLPEDWKIRIAVRLVGDWCELNEKGEGQNEHQRTQY